MSAEARNALASSLASGGGRVEREIEDVVVEGLPGEFVIFGYDSSIEDQRMNALYFETSKPVFIRQEESCALQAGGKIFLHFYPSGYAVLLVAIGLATKHPGFSVRELQDIIQETKPWREDNRWRWSSRLGTGTLRELVSKSVENLQHSLFVSYQSVLKRGNWRSAYRIVSKARSPELLSTLLSVRVEPKTMDLRSRSSSASYLVASNQGFACLVPPGQNRSGPLRFFWKILQLVEFVVLKEQIYRDYSDLLRGEVVRLKEFRLSAKRKATREDLRRFSVYDYKIPRFLSALDRHIRAAAPFIDAFTRRLQSG